MAFIYNKSELNIAGINAPTSISEIWFRTNTAGSTTLSGLEVVLGHTTLTNLTVSTTFANNFNVGPPLTVLNTASYVYTTLAGTWNVPADR